VAELLSMARTVVSSAKVADIVSDEVGRSEVNSKYSNGPRTLPSGTHARTRRNSGWSVPLLTHNLFWLWCLINELDEQLSFIYDNWYNIRWKFNGRSHHVLNRRSYHYLLLPSYNLPSDKWNIKFNFHPRMTLTNNQQWLSLTRYIYIIQPVLTE
jgi:hypothetical protein